MLLCDMQYPIRINLFILIDDSAIVDECGWKLTASTTYMEIF